MRKPNFKLKIELLNRGITQAKLACGIGRSPAHVCRIIRGFARLRARDRKRIAEFLGRPETELFHLHRRPRIESRSAKQVVAQSLTSGACGRSKPGNECAPSRPGAGAANKSVSAGRKPAAAHPISLQPKKGRRVQGGRASRPRV